MSKNRTTIVTYALLALMALVAFLLPDSILPAVHGAAPPDEMKLMGTIWDFKASHPDFEMVPNPGHTAANVAGWLGPDARPIFNAGGIAGSPYEDRVAYWKLDDGAGTTASDEEGLNNGMLKNGPTWVAGKEGSAVHFDGTNDYVEVANSPQMQIKGDITFAGWFKLDSNFTAGSLKTRVIMEKFLSTEKDFHIALAGADYNRPEVPKGRLVFKVENGPTTEYFCYVWSNQSMWQAGVWYHFAAVLRSSATSENKIINNGVKDTANVIAAGVGFLDTDYGAPMRIGGKTIDYDGLATDIYFKGTIDDVQIYDRALTADDFIGWGGGFRVNAEWRDSGGRNIAPQLYTPLSLVKSDACASLISDVAGVKGANTNGDITSAATFNEWFHDILGTNMSIQHSITLHLNGDVYEYLDDEFDPINGLLMGNEGLYYNRLFTYAITAPFKYHSCGKQFIEFQGGDGAWVFINGDLVLDLGGVRSTANQIVELDRLGLTDGEECTMHFFYSQRHSGASMFRMRTNIEFETETNVGVSARFD
jgi:fibro-slime domain-containing protein